MKLAVSVSTARLSGEIMTILIIFFVVLMLKRSDALIFCTCQPIIHMAVPAAKLIYEKEN